MTEFKFEKAGEEEESNERSVSKLREMVLKGKNYREDYEFEYFGETITLKLRPLRDPEFVELIERLDDTIDEEEFDEELEDIEDLDEEDVEEEFSSDFVEVMRDAAKLGIDPEPLGETREGIAELVDEMVGGVSIEIGAEVMEITSNLQDADRFR